MGIRAHELTDVTYPATLAGVRQSIEDLRDTGNRFCCYRESGAVPGETVTRCRNIDEELVTFATQLGEGREVDRVRLITTLREVDDLITQLEHRMSLPM